jgi:hypothetical protein
VSSAAPGTPDPSVITRATSGLVAPQDCNHPIAAFDARPSRLAPRSPPSNRIVAAVNPVTSDKHPHLFDESLTSQIPIEIRRCQDCMANARDPRPKSAAIDSTNAPQKGPIENTLPFPRAWRGDRGIHPRHRRPLRHPSRPELSASRCPRGLFLRPVRRSAADSTEPFCRHCSPSFLLR